MIGFVWDLSFLEDKLLKDCCIDHKYWRSSALANGADPDQTAPKGAVWSESAVFAVLLTSIWPLLDTQILGGLR